MKHTLSQTQQHMKMLMTLTLILFHKLCPPPSPQSTFPFSLSENSPPPHNPPSPSHSQKIPFPLHNPPSPSHSQIIPLPSVTAESVTLCDQE